MCDGISGFPNNCVQETLGKGAVKKPQFQTSQHFNGMEETCV